MSEPTTGVQPPTANSQPTTKNGQTGPKTPEGKKRSSLNALKHGLTATAPHAIAAAEGISEIDFEPYLKCMQDYFLPDDPLEHKLVERIARCFWRLDRAAEMDRRGYRNNHGATRPGDSNSSIVKYERMVDMQLGRAMKVLNAMRNPKRKDPPHNPQRLPEGQAPPSVEWERRMLTGRGK